MPKDCGTCIFNAGDSCLHPENLDLDKCGIEDWCEPVRFPFYIERNNKYITPEEYNFWRGSGFKIIEETYKPSWPADDNGIDRRTMALHEARTTCLGNMTKVGIRYELAVVLFRQRIDYTPPAMLLHGGRKPLKEVQQWEDDYAERIREAAQRELERWHHQIATRNT